MIVNLTGPGASIEPPDMRRNPYDISTWGSECGRGMPYRDVGVAVDGAKNQRRSISSGRKHRGSSSDDLAKQESRR